MDEWTNEERRRYQRIEKHFIISYYEQSDPEKKHHISQIKNISLGGMCFVATRSFEKMSKISIELKTPYLDDTVHLEGVVLNSIEKIPNLFFEIHMAFEKPSPEARMILEKTISYFKNNPQK